MGREFERALAMVGAALGFGSGDGTVEEVRQLLTEPASSNTSGTAEWKELISALDNVGGTWKASHWVGGKDLWHRASGLFFKFGPKTVANALWASPGEYLGRLREDGGASVRRMREILARQLEFRRTLLETARPPAERRLVAREPDSPDEELADLHPPTPDSFSPESAPRTPASRRTFPSATSRTVDVPPGVAALLKRPAAEKHADRWSEVLSALGILGLGTAEREQAVMQNVTGMIARLKALLTTCTAYARTMATGLLGELRKVEERQEASTPRAVPHAVEALLREPADPKQRQTWRHVLTALGLGIEDRPADERGPLVMLNERQVTAKLKWLLENGTRPTRTMATRLLVALDAPGERPGASGSLGEQQGAYCGRTNNSEYKGGCRFDKKACKDDPAKCDEVDRTWCYTSPYGQACRAKYAPVLKAEVVTPRRSCSLKPVPSKGERFTCHLDKSGNTRFEDAGYCTYKKGKRESCTTSRLAQPLDRAGVLRLYALGPIPRAEVAQSGRSKRPAPPASVAEDEVIQTARSIGSKGHSDAVYLEAYAKRAAGFRFARLRAAVSSIAADDGDIKSRQEELGEVRREFESHKDAFSEEDRRALSKEIGEAAWTLRGLANRAKDALKKAAAVARKAARKSDSEAAKQDDMAANRAEIAALDEDSRELE
jgi:hypothetical protein